MAKRTIADKDGHTCITKKDLVDYDNNPTEAKARIIQNAMDQCVHCKTLVTAWKDNH